MTSRVDRGPSVSLHARCCAVLFAICTPLLLQRVGADATAPGGGAKPLTVPEAIDTCRLQGYEYGRDPNPIVASPDALSFATMQVCGDTKANRVRMDVLVGRLGTFESTGIQKRTTFFTSGLGAPERWARGLLTYPGANPLRWIDSRHIAFYWLDGADVIQLFSMDIETGASTQLTHSDRDLEPWRWSVYPRDGTLLYVSTIPYVNKSVVEAEEGFAVESAEASSVLNGFLDGSTYFSRHIAAWYLQMPGKRAVRVSLGPEGHIQVVCRIAAFSPDGRHAILDGPPERADASWLGYSAPQIQLMTRQWLHREPGTSRTKYLKTLYVLDIDHQTIRPLWDVPMDGDTEGRVSVEWSPDGQSVVIGPTLLPLPTVDAGGLAGTAVAEVNVMTGAVHRVPLDLDVMDPTRPKIEWNGPNDIDVHAQISANAAAARQFSRAGNVWKRAATAPVKSRTSPPISVTVEETINDPPKLYIVENSTGRRRMLLDPNPDLRSKALLGLAKAVHWQDSSGFTWQGILYYPAGYQPGRAYPLVLQTHGIYSQTHFSLYGANADLGPGTGVYAAQVLAGKGIAVLQVADNDDLQAPAHNAENYKRGYDAAIRFAVDGGIADDLRIGIQGFSHTGWIVEYLISHPDRKYQAALTSDNATGGYLESVVTNPGMMNQEIGAPPFGKGLYKWLQKAPGFNAERVATPLLGVLQTGPLSHILPKWELYSRLRWLKKPVELFVIPDVEHGGHNLQNPRQLAVLQQRSVDWFDFWLNGHEDPDPAKAKQYRGWETLCDLQRANATVQRTFCVPSSR